MGPMMKVILFALSICGAYSVEHIHTTEVFVMPLEVNTFNWGSDRSVLRNRNGFWFRPTIAGAPDLPAWLSYAYSERNKSGFLYGVPPHFSTNYKIEVVCVDLDNYETARKMVRLNVTEKPDRAKYEVQVKLHNRDVLDMFEEGTLSKLMGVFKQVLWPESKSDLYLTFLASPLHLGARRPINPHHSDGVVVKLGSGTEFSERLVRLEEETMPLWKRTCPRDKKSTEDRHFSALGLHVDWCSFRLLRKDVGEMDGSGSEGDNGSDWRLPLLSEVPSRSYGYDFIITILLPLFVLLLLVVLLSTILCFHHQALNDPSSDQYFEMLFNCEDLFRGKEIEENDITLIQYEAVQRATNSLRSMSNNRDTESTQRVVPEKDTGRPSPPPYGATRRIVNMDS